MNPIFIPDNAPFNEDQKAWLRGFLAGAQAHAAMLAAQNPASDNDAPKKELNIFFGTQTGNAETVALDAASIAKTQGFAPVVAGLDDVAIEDLAKMQAVLIVISTYGEGEMPDNAQIFWDELTASTAPRMEQLNFGVLALGDTSYDEFCHAGKLIDTRLEQLGAKRMLARVDCDVDFEDLAATWIADAMPLASEVAGVSEGGADTAAPATQEKSKWSRKNPYHSAVIENRLLSGKSSAKEIRHFSFDLAGSEMTYEAGDALGVIPTNDEELVDAIIAKLGANDDQPIAKFDAPLKEVLQTKLEIMTPSKDMVMAINERAKDEELTTILSNGDKDALENFLWGRDTLDLLDLGDGQLFTAEEFVDQLKPLQHRAYSISSSPKAHNDEVHLTVAAVRWAYEGREHKGVCSTFLADVTKEGDELPIFMSPNRSFRIPSDNDVPMIMVGPGTGIAPFRAFLEERREIGANGKNWLFFGDQHRAEDFIYEDEIGQMSNDGILNRLDLAFSRDQSEKIYVQSRMLENGKELFAWLEEGGYFYVCGDATRMAKDVDEMLRRIIQEQGGFSDEAADGYMSKLKKEKRYLRDVY